MPDWIDHHGAHRRIRLLGSLCSTQPFCGDDRRVEVDDPEVEMELLRLRLSGPLRRGIVRDGLEVEREAVDGGLSVRRLQRICRNHLGVSPRWLLRRARVLDGHELLLSTELPIAEIAARLGWCDQAHFTRDYAAITGVPPAARRRERQPER